MKIVHGEGRRGQRTAEYRIWMDMMKRCNNPNRVAYARYGGRGINVCVEWHDYANFLADMGRRPSDQHSIDRVDNDGNYAPGNCRWATKKEQAQNTKNVDRAQRLEFQGRLMTLREWGEDLGICPSLLAARIRRLGWSVERALTTPVKGAS